MTPARRLVYWFLHLSHVTRGQIIRELGLREPGYQQKNDCDYEDVFRNAREQGKLEQLWQAVEAAHGHTTSDCGSPSTRSAGVSDQDRDCAVEVLTNWAGQYVYPEGRAISPQQVIDRAIEKSAEIIGRHVASTSRADRDTIERLRGEIKALEDKLLDARRKVQVSP